MTRRSIALFFFFFIFLAACNRVEGPAEAYASFVRAAQKGDYKTAHATLSSNTRQLLEERAKSISAASGGAVKDDGAALFFATAPRHSPLSEVKVVKEEGDHATVSATAGGSVRTVKMVRESGAWKVDLSAALKSGGTERQG